MLGVEVAEHVKELSVLSPTYGVMPLARTSATATANTGCPSRMDRGERRGKGTLARPMHMTAPTASIPNITSRRPTETGGGRGPGDG